jgi:hypothetical protein
MNVSEVFDRVRTLLTDEGMETWDETEWTRWLNDARSTAYVMRPDLFSITAPMTLVAGSYQTVPDESKRLFDVVRNLSHRDKRQITPVDPDIMNRLRPNRVKQTQVEEVQHFIYDETDPTVFEVYPPAKVGVEIEVRYALPPLPVADTSEELEEEGPLAFGLADFIVARCYQQEVDASPGQANKAANHIAQFQALFAGDAASQAAASPNANREGSVKTK